MLKLGSICFLMRKKSIFECLEMIITKPEKPKLASSGEESIHKRQKKFSFYGDRFYWVPMISFLFAIVIF